MTVTKPRDYTTAKVGAKKRDMNGRTRLVVTCPKCSKPGLCGPVFNIKGKTNQSITHGEEHAGFAIFVKSCSIAIWKGEQPVAK